MSTENYPSDDRTFPRNWTNFKKTLTWPKRMYLGWLGDGTKYDDVQSFLNAELPSPSFTFENNVTCYMSHISVFIKV